MIDEKLQAFLQELSVFGRENDGAQADRAKKMLNIAPDTGRLLWILVASIAARRVLEVGTSNALSTISARGRGASYGWLRRHARTIDVED